LFAQAGGEENASSRAGRCVQVRGTKKAKVGQAGKK
jgi:hypothetical protein